MISVRESIQDAVAAIEQLYNLEAPIRSAAQVLEQALLSGKKVLTCGNGGSAADSSHMATEIACRFIAAGDVLIALSTSGHSENIGRALEQAKARTIGDRVGGVGSRDSGKPRAQP